MARFSRRTLPVPLLWLAVLLPACQMGGPRDDSVPQAIDATLTEAIQSQPKLQAPPPAVAAALLPAPSGAVTNPVREEPRFTISVKESPARQFFMSLVQGTPHNMVVHPGVEGAITINPGVLAYIPSK